MLGVRIRDFGGAGSSLKHVLPVNVKLDDDVVEVTQSRQTGGLFQVAARGGRLSIRFS
jgi:hypothetical protein